MSGSWLDWAKRIQSLAQAGLTFSKDVYDLERYEELRKISFEIMAAHTGMEMEAVSDLFAGEEGYQTPKIDVRGVIIQAGKIMLVQEKLDGKWALPGGFCDVGLSPSENVTKEVKEETGLDVRPVRLLALLDKSKHPHPPEPFHYYKLFIHCEPIGGRIRAGTETYGARFFSEAELPELSENRNTESQVRMMFSSIRANRIETIFD